MTKRTWLQRFDRGAIAIIGMLALGSILFLYGCLQA